MPSNTHEKRASLLRVSDYTETFHKDWQRLTRSGRYNMKLLKEVMLLLIANNEPPSAEWKDHALARNWDDHRECHVGGDFLLSFVPETATPALKAALIASACV